MVKKIKATVREKVTLFSIIMTTIMVTGMSSLNMIWNGVWAPEVFFSHFPILFVAAFLLQSFVAMPLAKKVTSLRFETAKNND